MQGSFGKFIVDALQLPKMFDINKLREAEPDLFEDLCKDYPVEAGNVFISIKGD